MNKKQSNETQDPSSNVNNDKMLGLMKEIIEKKQNKSNTQKGLAGIDKSIGEKRKKIYRKPGGGLFDR